MAAIKKKKQDPLHQLLKTASPDVLVGLVENLAAMEPEVRRQCFEYLKKRVTLTSSQTESATGEAILALWLELEPDLFELDDYGGGDYGLVDHVGDLLYEIQEKLQKDPVAAEYRKAILAEVLPYIRSGNAGLDDELYSVAYAACYCDDDLFALAQNFETIKKGWSVDHARRIYKRIGENQKYLELRALKMELGADYHDLATFHWEQGEKKKAIEVARQGLKKAHGRMDELRQFLAERAEESGDRKEFIELQFEQAADHLTLEKYKALQKICSKEEWERFEGRLLGHITRTWGSEQLKIHMHRRNYEAALNVLVKSGYPDRFDGGYDLQVAAKLEKRFPEQILKYYYSGLGNLNYNSNRKEYARKAKVMVKVRHMYVDILKDPQKWLDFARQVKASNKRRPAFQQEFAIAVEDWQKIV